MPADSTAIGVPGFRPKWRDVRDGDADDIYAIAFKNDSQLPTEPYNQHVMPKSSSKDLMRWTDHCLRAAADCQLRF
jgi:hypothetical protein